MPKFDSKNQNRNKNKTKPRGSAPNLGAMGGRAIPGLDTGDARCKICSSAYRRHIDMMLTTGWTQSECCRFWNRVLQMDGDDTEFTKDGFSRHTRHHLDLQDKTVRHIIEARARRTAEDIDEAAGLILTKEAALEIVVHKALASMTSGATAAEPKDLIAAIEMLRKIEDDQREVAVDEMMRDYRAFSLAVQAVLEDLAPHVGRTKDELFQQVWQRYELTLKNARPVLELTAVPPVIEGVVTEDEYGSG